MSESQRAVKNKGRQEKKQPMEFGQESEYQSNKLGGTQKSLQGVGGVRMRTVSGGPTPGSEDWAPGGTTAKGERQKSSSGNNLATKKYIISPEKRKG